MIRKPTFFISAISAMVALVAASVAVAQPPYDDEDEEPTTSVWDSISEGIRRGTEQALPVMEQMRQRNEEQARARREEEMHRLEMMRAAQEIRNARMAAQAQRTQSSGYQSNSGSQPSNGYPQGQCAGFVPETTCGPAGCSQTVCGVN